MKGMDSSMSAFVGITARHGALVSETSLVRSAARMPMTLQDPRYLKRLLGTVNKDRIMEFGAISNSSPASVTVRIRT